MPALRQRASCQVCKRFDLNCAEVTFEVRVRSVVVAQDGCFFVGRPLRCLECLETFVLASLSALQDLGAATH